jgi:ParB/RepB/Spo0J family partition protein
MSRDIPLSKIRPDSDQPRKRFDADKLHELADSMRAVGLSTPILLRPFGEGFVIVHGERRYRAAGLLGWETIPADVRDMTPEEARILSLVENLQRDDLTPIEEARAYQSMLSGMTQAELGRQLGKSQSYIANKLRLLKMPEFLQSMLDAGFLTEGHVKQILRLRKFYNGARIEHAKRDDGKTSDDFDDEITMLALFFGYRPLDKWLLQIDSAFEPSPKRAELARIARNYFRQFDAGGVEVVWHGIALWHAATAATAPLSVVELNMMLTRFFELATTAWLWADRVYESTKMGHTMKWGYKSDLRRARLTGDRGPHGDFLHLGWGEGSPLYPTNIQYELAYNPQGEIARLVAAARAAV